MSPNTLIGIGVVVVVAVVAAVVAILSGGGGNGGESGSGGSADSVFAQPGSLWINEFHYDNVGSDVGEFIEVAYTTGTNLASIRILLYNGNDGEPYDSVPLIDFTVSDTATSNDNTVVFATYDIVLQNGSPDVIALVNDTDAASESVIEFLSYEGTLTATSGVAAGLTSIDVGVSESNTDLVGQSLQRTGTGCSLPISDFTWIGPVKATKGQSNSGQDFRCGDTNNGGTNPTTVSPTTSPVDTIVVSPPTGGCVPIDSAPSGICTTTSTVRATDNAPVFVVDIPAGTTDMYIQLDSNGYELDIELRRSDQVVVVGRSGTWISGMTPSSVSIPNQNNDPDTRYDYSGALGDDTGSEFVYISGTSREAMSLYVALDSVTTGAESATTDPVATITYSWGYYSSIRQQTNPLTGLSLKTALHEIIDDHIEISYTECWEALKRTDPVFDNPSAVRLLYSQRAESKSLQDSGCFCPDNWNREHVWAKSHGNFGTTQGAGTDLHALRPADKSVNTERSAKDFAEGGSLLSSADSREDCPTCRKTATSFEPPNTVKGSIARMLFYMAIRYNGDAGSNGVTLDLVDGVGTPYGTDTSSSLGQLGDLATLREWNTLFPPTDEEFYRNTIIYQIQGNRNPFIDNYLWVDEIF